MLAACGRSTGLTVQVRDSVTGQPVAGAKVRLSAVRVCDPFAPRDSSAVTDTDGLAKVWTRPYEYGHTLTATERSHEMCMGHLWGLDDAASPIGFRPSEGAGEVFRQADVGNGQPAMVLLRLMPR
jgi:hypothetical protein